ncbi:Hsp70 family protein, partial [Mycobacterium sp.]|uniref:Hsp70 family protein n=1 Tax=Mycobacterium sp. TaxID=1785 RepID=UPI002CB64F63
VRLTRAELEDEIRGPLAEFMSVVHETLARNGVRPSDLAAVASVGGGANIPFVTTTLSEHLRVPVLTTRGPELMAALGAALEAPRTVTDDRATTLVRAAVLAPDAEEAPAPPPGLAWSQEEPLPELDLSSARPQLQFQPNDWLPSSTDSRQAWYRRPLLAAAGTAAALALMAGAVVLHQQSAPLAATTTPTSVGPSPAAPSAPAPAAASPGRPGQPQGGVQAPVPVAQSRPIEQQADQLPPPVPAANPQLPVVVAPPPIPGVAPAPQAPADPPPPSADTPTPAPPTTPPPVATTTTLPPTTTTLPPTITTQPPTTPIAQPPPTITQPPTTTRQPPPTKQPPPTTTEAPPPSSEPPSTTQSDPHGHR